MLYILSWIWQGFDQIKAILFYFLAKPPQKWPDLANSFQFYLFLLLILTTYIHLQLPEHIGSVRTISQGKGSQLMLGTTRNSILQGTFELSFHEIITGHVDEACIAAHPHQSQFLSAGYDHHIHLWDTLSHRAIWSSSLGVRALKQYTLIYFHTYVLNL